MVTFDIEKVYKNDGRTFSEEAVYSFLEGVWDYINKVFSGALHQGFEKGEPVEKVRIKIEWEVNGKSFDEAELLKSYPKLVGFSLEALAEHILKKAYGGGR